MEITTISKNTIFEGTIKTEDVIKIEGTFVGEKMQTTKILTGKDSIIQANAIVENIVIAGKFIGNITAEKSIEISPTGEVQGNVISPVFNVAPGAKYKGNCTILSSDGELAKNDKPGK